MEFNTSATSRNISNLLSSADEHDGHCGHDLNQTFSQFAGVAFSIIIISAVSFNSILIFTIAFQRRLHSVTHVFIVNLAVSDIVTASVTIPFDVDFMLRGHYDHGLTACGIMQVSFLMSLPTSVISLCLLTLDRYVSVRFPFDKARFFNWCSIGALLGAAWAYTFAVALFPIILDRRNLMVEVGYCVLSYPLYYNIFLLVVNFLIPVIVIIMLNVDMFRIANRHGVALKRASRRYSTPTLPHKRSSHTSVSDGSSGYRHRLSSVYLNTKAAVKRRTESVSENANMKAAKRILLLVGVFVMCWMTFIILVVSNIACNGCHPRELTWSGNIVNYASTALNPLLYGVLNKQLRNEFCKACRKLFASEFIASTDPIIHKDRSRQDKGSLLSNTTTSYTNVEVRMWQREAIATKQDMTSAC